jgi:hypothetical protein
LHIPPLVDDDDEIGEGGVTGWRDEGWYVHASGDTRSED